MRVVEKGWGREVIFADTPLYAGKLLEFERKGAQFSLHFHAVKDETWHVIEGEFTLVLLDTTLAGFSERHLVKGDTWRNAPLVPHRLICLTDRGVIVEVSTHDDPADNYRIAKGDSQSG